MTKFIPAVLTSAKVFMSRQLLVLDPATNSWQADPVRSDPTPEQMLADWRRAERPEIRFISPPSASIYNQGATEQILFIGVSVLYVPAVEGADSARQARPAKKVETVVVQAKPAGSATAGVFRPPGA
jgi:hypothetical protein